METNITPPFRRLVPDELIGGNTHYRIPEGQIIFYFEEWESFVITTISQEEDYSVAHYNLLPEMAPYQLINGKLTFMAAPEEIHQAVLNNINVEIYNYLRKNKKGILRIAPVDVVLGDGNVLQPDILFVSIKRNSIINRKVFGAPDFVVEILSTNSDYDRNEKFDAYQQHGVEEYWIVHPTEKYVEVYHRENDLLQLVQKAEGGGQIVSKAIEGFEMNVEDIFLYDLDEFR